MNIRKTYTLRKDIVAVLRKYPNISADEVAKHFQIKAAVDEILIELERGVEYGIFQKIDGFDRVLYNTVQNTYTTRLIDYFGPKKLKKSKSNFRKTKNTRKKITNPRRVARKRAREIGKIGRHQTTTRKAFADTERVSYVISDVNSRHALTPKERSKYVADLKKLQNDLSDLRRNREELGLDGVDRGALK